MLRHKRSIIAGSEGKGRVGYGAFKIHGIVSMDIFKKVFKGKNPSLHEVLLSAAGDSFGHKKRLTLDDDGKLRVGDLTDEMEMASAAKKDMEMSEVAWVRALDLLVDFHAELYPRIARDFLSYPRLISSLSATFGTHAARTYDVRWRAHAASITRMNRKRDNDSRLSPLVVRWDEIDRDLRDEVSHNMRAARCDLCQSPDHETRDHPRRQKQGGDYIGKPDRSKGGTCNLFNRSTCKYGDKCRFRHACGKCGGTHSALACKKPIEGDAASAAGTPIAP
jgi:hypothetical protein